MQRFPQRCSLAWPRRLLVATRRRRYVRTAPARGMGHAVRVGLASCGAGAHGEHGLGTNAMVPLLSAVPLPQEAPGTAGAGRGLPLPPSHLGCGLAHTVATNASGTVLAWGRADGGRLGNGDEEEEEEDLFAPEPAFRILDSSVADVAAGALHSVLLLGASQAADIFAATASPATGDTPFAADGQVFSWGYGGFGQLGHGDCRRRVKPAAVSYFDPDAGADGPHAGSPCVRVACGGSHTLALTADGAVHAWGRVDNGRLGTGQSVPTVSEALAATHRTALADYWMAGEKPSGEAPRPRQRGRGGGAAVDAAAVHALPTPVAGAAAAAPTGDPVRALACGPFTSFALTAGGRVLAWGGCQHGELGRGTVGEDVLAPELMAAPGGEAVTAIACGALYTLFLTESGAVFATGDAGYGSLGGAVRPGSHTATPARLPAFGDGAPHGRARAVWSGSHHALVQGEDGRLWGFGENAFGQLGLGYRRRVADPEQVSLAHALAAHHDTVRRTREEAEAGGRGGGGGSGAWAALRSVLGLGSSDGGDGGGKAAEAVDDTEGEDAVRARETERMLRAAAEGDTGVGVRVAEAALGAGHSVLALEVVE